MKLEAESNTKPFFLALSIFYLKPVCFEDYTTDTYFATPWVTSFTFCLFTPIFVNIKKLLIHGLEGLKICHKFQHQNLQSSQGY